MTVRDLAPLAAFLQQTERIYVSESLGCFTHSAPYASVNMVAVCKK